MEKPGQAACTQCGELFEFWMYEIKEKKKKILCRPPDRYLIVTQNKLYHDLIH